MRFAERRRAELNAGGSLATTAVGTIEYRVVDWILADERRLAYAREVLELPHPVRGPGRRTGERPATVGHP